MDKEMLLHYIAPCSLFCYTCPALKDGAISQCARRLSGYFEGYYDFIDANVPEEEHSWRNKIKAFEEELHTYTDRPCPGCRNNPSETGCIDGCVVPPCVKEKGIDFCSECPEFPCEKGKAFFAGVNDVIGHDWINGNRRIADVGAERYYEENKDKSHYKSYKK